MKFLIAQHLPPHRSIACITYTNAAAEEIAVRLPTGARPEFLGTIHAFLLRYLLHPYGHALSQLPEDWHLVVEGYAQKHMYSLARDCVISQAKSRVPDVVAAFERIGYSLNGELTAFGDRSLKLPEMRAFVRQRLEQGEVSEQDILWFSLCILRDPELRYIGEALSCRFASILVDEFQDTTEVQYAVLEELHRFGRTSLFLVGDPNQSIFSFAGANPATFRHCLGCFPCYEVIGNRRCTSRITTFLNLFVAPDQAQESTAEWRGSDIPVYVLVGGRADALCFFRGLVQRYGLSGESRRGPYLVLARGNELRDEMERLERGGAVSSDALEIVRRKNSRLGAVLKGLFQACRLREIGEYSQAFRCADRAVSRLVFDRVEGFGDPAALGLDRDGWRLVLVQLLDQLHPTTEDIRQWAGLLKRAINECVVAAGGKKCGPKLSLLGSVANVLPKRGSYPVEAAIQHVELPDEVVEGVSTVHKAKGQEREAVLVVAANAAQLVGWVKLANRDEESRIGFVAFSRARKLLCITVESLSQPQRSKLERLGCLVVTNLQDAGNCDEPPQLASAPKQIRNLRRVGRQPATGKPAALLAQAEQPASADVVQGSLWPDNN